MLRKRYRAEEIIHKLQKVEVVFGQGKSTAEVCKKLALSRRRTSAGGVNTVA